ncbi:hypothetical protein L1987_56714 [Smallanthus sonchifolius]|uniref:Uncharacterized protein n=1 Tax=Smallanthus sonchifolius TaxID=185202 RepID=A0ACB9EDY6_9ASTR|nr:hypothetical protein L1987_56714 [Smallanthus sonchifolius]
MQLNDLEKRELDIHSMKHVIKLHARKTFKAQPPDPPSNPLNETLMDTNLDPYPNNNPNTIPTQISSDQETFVYKLANGVEIIIFEDHFDLLEQERIAVVMYFVDKKQWPNIDDVADWSLLQSKLFLKLSEKYGIKEDPDLVIMEEESDVESENDESTAFMQLDGKGTQLKMVMHENNVSLCCVLESHTKKKNIQSVCERLNGQMTVLFLLMLNSSIMGALVHLIIHKTLFMNIKFWPFSSDVDVLSSIPVLYPKFGLHLHYGPFTAKHVVLTMGTQGRPGINSADLESQVVP